MARQAISCGFWTPNREEGEAAVLEASGGLREHLAGAGLDCESKACGIS